MHICMMDEHDGMINQETYAEHMSSAPASDRTVSTMGRNGFVHVVQTADRGPMIWLFEQSFKIKLIKADDEREDH